MNASVLDSGLVDKLFFSLAQDFGETVFHSPQACIVHRV